MRFKYPTSKSICSAAMIKVIGRLQLISINTARTAMYSNSKNYEFDETQELLRLSHT